MTAALWMTISALWWTPTAAVFQQQAPTDTTANDTADGQRKRGIITQCLCLIFIVDDHACAVRQPLKDDASRTPHRTFEHQALRRRPCDLR